MTAPILVIGNLNVDVIMGPQEPWPTPGTEVVLQHSDVRVGGAAGNTALALQAMGTPYQLLANRGCDVFGAWLASAFPDQRDPPVAEAASAISVGITHPDGERTFFTTLGHLAYFDLACVEAQLLGRVEPDGVTLLSGTFVTPALLADYSTLLAGLRQRGDRVALDTGWPASGWTPTLRAQVRDWLPNCSHLLINEAEVRGMAGENDTEVAIRSILPSLAPDAVLVIKCGADGALAVHGTEWFSIPAPDVAVADTVGAGDVFNAGYLAATAEGCTPAEATRRGVHLASRIISTHPRRYRE